VILLSTRRAAVDAWIAAGRRDSEPVQLAGVDGAGKAADEVEALLQSNTSTGPRRNRTAAAPIGRQQVA